MNVHIAIKRVAVHGPSHIYRELLLEHDPRQASRDETRGCILTNNHRDHRCGPGVLCLNTVGKRSQE